MITPSVLSDRLRVRREPPPLLLRLGASPFPLWDWEKWGTARAPAALPLGNDHAAA